MLRSVIFLLFFTFSYQHEEAPLRDRDILIKQIPAWAPPINSEHRIPDVLPRRVLILRHIPLWENRPEEKDFSLLGRPTLDRYGGNDAITGARKFTDDIEGYGTSDTNAVCPSPPYKPCVSQAEANSRARRCCENNKDIPSGCYPLCSLSVKMPVMAKYITEGKCPYSAMGSFLSCLSEKKDLRDCCVFKKMPPVCQAFCNPLGHLPEWNEKTLICKDWFDELTSCFHAGMTPIF